VVVQCDADNRRSGTIIVAMITKQTALVGRERRHILRGGLTPSPYRLIPLSPFREHIQERGVQVGDWSAVFHERSLLE